MKWMFALLYSLVVSADVPWNTDFEVARKEAHASNRLILLNFSGSDWCGPCMRLKEEVFNSDLFTSMADSALVLCNADFPRSKRNRLSPERQKSNEALADVYNPLGKFPFTVLLNADGKILRSWDGYPQSDKQLFLDQLKIACDAYNKR